MPKRLVVVGAGTGGLMVSNHVARRLASEIRQGKAAVTLLGNQHKYLYQPGLLYVPFDLMRPSELIRPVKELLVPGVQFVHQEVTGVEPAKQLVRTRDGQQFEYDYLVLATGSQLNPEEVPGLAEGGHQFYTLQGALKLRDTLRNFKGGHLVLAIGLPHKCPVAPLEFTFMFDEWTRRRGIRDQTQITYTFPINRAHSIEKVAQWAEAEFEKRGIALETFFNMETVDPQLKQITSLEGTTFTYDLLVSVPPHKGADVWGTTGFGEAGNWLPTHRHELRIGHHENIFAVGDATNLPVSKAGSVAHFQAEVLGENLSNLMTGGGPAHEYTGKAFCFIEAGLDTATYIVFDYQTPPTLNPPTEWMHWFKQAYNRIHWLNLRASM